MLPLKLDSESVLKELSTFAVDVSDSFGMVGQGIGAIMLLVVVFYYITSILDGGKFQIKMMLPFLIFFIVCNFSWISKPVVSFTSAITEELVKSCASEKASLKDKVGCREGATFSDMANATHQDEANDSGPVIEEVYEGMNRGKDAPKDTVSEPKTKGIYGKISYHVKKGIGEAATKGSLDFQKETSVQGLNTDGNPDGKGFKPTTRNLGFLGLFAGLISFICTLMSSVLSAFGGIMTGLILAFGPITFAFAIFPGQGGTVKSWFIRLCQFSLWAPICALIDVFSVKIFCMLSGADSGASVAMTIAVALCNLVALTSVPSIASMIIEGASGAVSLSQGLQAMGGALTVVGGLGMKGFHAVAGKDNAISRTEGLKKQGASGLIRDVQAGKKAGDSNAWKHALQKNQAFGRKAINK